MWNIQLNTQSLEFNKKMSPTSIIRNNFSEIIEEKYPHHTKIFTDASKSSHGTGFAFVENNKTSMFKPPPETSIFSAESQAIHKAISHAMTLVSEKILIISDSLSALLALKNPYPKNEIIQAIQEEITHSRKKIEFIWVPSHTGIIGNELADKAANEAIASPSAVTINKITFQDALKTINNLTKSLCNTMINLPIGFRSNCWKSEMAKFLSITQTKKLPGAVTLYKSVDSALNEDDVVNYPVEFLMEPPTMPLHCMNLKFGSSIIFLRNLNAPNCATAQDYL
ncbi:hypothetical protein QTP88_003551 [Uroleucon formosanum]